jgi:hypothetical protein
MSSAIFNILPEAAIEPAQFLILACESSELFTSLVDLIDPQSECIFCLIKHLCEIVISHYFSLCGFVVMQTLAFELFGKTTNFGDVLL